MDGRRAWLSGLPALVKTASQEWPRASVKAIDLERGGRDAEEIARALAEELLHGGGEIEVALPAAGGRFTLRSVERDVEPGEPVIGPGDVVVVSGGARGVTSACLAEWARDSRARFVLLGRTALAEEPAGCGRSKRRGGSQEGASRGRAGRGESPAPAELGARVRDVLANREIRSTLAALEAAGSPARYEAVNVVRRARALPRPRASAGGVGPDRGRRPRGGGPRGPEDLRQDRRAVRPRLRHEGRGAARASRGDRRAIR